ncbi:MAG: hypothetical protein L0I76_20280, partial [Pseudonocardia sp.]|nr:hypothetical protein [Pseudonocardia sp.]
DDDAPTPPVPAEATADTPVTRSRHRRTPDAVRPGIALDVDTLRHRRSLARAASGDDQARAALERTATDEDHPVRERAEASAGLAIVLRRSGHRGDAAAHARRAHLLALRIGAPRIAVLAAAALAGSGPADPGPTGRGNGAQPSVAPARSSSAAE